MGWLNDYAIEAADRIKAAGFRVFMSEQGTYGFFSDGIGIGYFEAGFPGIRLNTVNAKGSDLSGYSVKGDSDGYRLEELTEETLRKAFATYPAWVRSSDAKRCVKYRNLEQFLNEYWGAKNLKEL